MKKELFQEQYAPLIPGAAGVYKYYNKDKKLIYVGKAKNLKKRVSSYFAKKHDNYKTTRLVQEINQIEWTITDHEHDAFLLENSLIKHFQPKYNISLKDDKTYPYVVIKKEPFPRIFITRRLIRDGSEYIGPFTGVWRVRELLEIIKQSIPLRTCGLNLTKSNIERGKFKVCLEYHLGNCAGPCEGLQSEVAYKANLQQARSILKGNLSQVMNSLKEQMNEAASSLNFEKAQIIKSKMDGLQSYNSQSAVVSSTIGNLDVATIIIKEGKAYINYMIIAEGSVLHSHNATIEILIEETSDQDILAHAVSIFRPKFQSIATEILVPFTIPIEEKNLRIAIPKLGERKKLLELSFKNLEYYKEEQAKKARLHIKEKTAQDYENILEQLQEDLQLSSLPEHIECFDNSNFQGSNPVAAMVCFKNGQPFKSEYRKFHIRTVEGINDFASMEEIVYRRYKRVMEEKKPLPQLVIIDGGKGQLGAAMKSIEKLGLIGRMTIVGLAKREESIFFPGDKNPLNLPYNGQTLLLIRRIRDEVHRFGITFHRDVRSTNTFTNELENIKGIGQKTAQTLLQTFRSVQKVKELSLQALTEVVGKAKAKLIIAHFEQSQD